MALLCLVTGFAGSARAREGLDEAATETVRVRSVELRGVENVDEDGLAGRILTSQRRFWEVWKRRPVFDEFQLEGDLERAEAYYRAHGYYEARARSELSWNEARNLVDIEILIEEGEVVKLAQLAISIAPEATDRFDRRTRATLIDNLPLLVDEPFGIERYKAAKEELVRRLAALAHPRATLERVAPRWISRCTRLR